VLACSHKSDLSKARTCSFSEGAMVCVPANPFALKQAASGLKKVEAFEVRMLQDLNVGRGGLYASNAQARDGYWSIAVSANAGPQSACPRCRSISRTFVPGHATCACCHMRSSYFVVMPLSSVTCDNGHLSPSLQVPVL